MNTTIKTQLNSTTSMLAAGLFALICAATGGGALAAEPSESLTKIVHYGDLNLDSEQGAAALYARLRSAAKVHCTFKPSIGPNHNPSAMEFVSVTPPARDAGGLMRSVSLDPGFFFGPDPMQYSLADLTIDTGRQLVSRGGFERIGSAAACSGRERSRT
jgi:UrcA family protein